MNIKIFSLCLVTLVYFDVSATEKQTVYRWVDKLNVVHFSQHQPDHDDYTEISMASNKKSSVIMDKESSTDSPRVENSDLTNSTEDSNLSQDKCLIARENISTLESFDKIQYKDEKGSLKVLNSKEKQQQIEINTKQAEVYCTDNSK